MQPLTTNWQPALHGHLPVLDGIRGLAVVMVMLGHFLVLQSTNLFDQYLIGVAQLGWVGVDLFFVLSGFLITGILFDARGKSHYFRNFYMRRILRILPLYYACCAIAVFVFPPLVAGYYRHGTPYIEHWGLWYWLHLSNLSRSWWGGNMNVMLSVTWSLAIEEQFYIVWPLLVCFCSRRTLMGISLFLILQAWASRFFHYYMGADPFAIYASTHTRLDGLALGSMIALYARGPVSLTKLVKPAGYVALITLIALSAVIVVSDTDFLMTGMQLFGYGLWPLVFAAILTIAVATPPNQFIPRFFQSRVLRWFGKYSYGLYIVHFPISFFLKMPLPRLHVPQIAGSDLPLQILVYLVGFGLSIAAALISWNLLEKHFLALKDRWTIGSASSAHPKSPELVESIPR